MLSSSYHITSVYGNNKTSWRNLAFQYGTADNVYFEDDTCTSIDVFHAGGGGGRYYARHKTYTYSGTSSFWPFFDQHGNQGSSEKYAGMGIEIYENTLNCTHNEGGLAFDHRGGRAICYNNNVITTGGVSFRCREEYNNDLNPPARASHGETQHVYDSYYWSNTTSGLMLIEPKIEGTINYGGWIGIVPQLNRDSWKRARPFSGRVGMGAGPLSARPASGVPGVGYWAADMKKLFRWKGNNAWEELYTPYICPHPHASRTLSSPFLNKGRHGTRVG